MTKIITLPPLKDTCPAMGRVLHIQKSLLLYDINMFWVYVSFIFFTNLLWLLFIYTPKYICIKTNKYSYTKGDILTSLKLLLIYFYVNVVIMSHLAYVAVTLCKQSIAH